MANNYQPTYSMKQIERIKKYAIKGLPYAVIRQIMGLPDIATETISRIKHGKYQRVGMNNITASGKGRHRSAVILKADKPRIIADARKGMTIKQIVAKYKLLDRTNSYKNASQAVSACLTRAGISYRDLQKSLKQQLTKTRWGQANYSPKQWQYLLLLLPTGILLRDAIRKLGMHKEFTNIRCAADAIARKLRKEGIAYNSKRGWVGDPARAGKPIVVGKRQSKITPELFAKAKVLAARGEYLTDIVRKLGIGDKYETENNAVSALNLMFKRHGVKYERIPNAERQRRADEARKNGCNKGGNTSSCRITPELYADLKARILAGEMMVDAIPKSGILKLYKSYASAFNTASRMLKDDGVDYSNSRHKPDAPTLAEVLAEVKSLRAELAAIKGAR